MMVASGVPRPQRKPGHVTIRTRFVSFRFNYRVLGMSALALVALLAVAIWAMTLGTYPIPFTHVADIVFHTDYTGAKYLADGTLSPEWENREFVVNTLRFPRVLCALMIGVALAMSGAIFQGLVRNALVSPDIIGINTGASLVAVVWIIFGIGIAGLPLAAFLGALLTATTIYLLSWRGGINPQRLILVGIGIAALLSAVTTYVTLLFPVEVIRPAVVWTLGSVYGSTWSDVRVLALFLAVLAPAAVVLMWMLRVLQLGDDVSRGLGVSLERTRLALMVVGCGLAAGAVAIAGPVGFVALMVPHIARMIAGPLSGSVMVLTGVLGGLFLLAADVIAQHFLPVSLPVGVITAAVGAPYFLFLLYRSNVRI